MLTDSAKLLDRNHGWAVDIYGVIIEFHFQFASNVLVFAEVNGEYTLLSRPNDEGIAATSSQITFKLFIFLLFHHFEGRHITTPARTLSFGNDAGLGIKLEIEHDKTHCEKPIFKCVLNTLADFAQIFEVIFNREVEIQ